MKTISAAPPDALAAPASRPTPWRSRDELLRLADLTLAEYARHVARYDGTVYEEDGLLLFAGPHPNPNPYRNGAIRLDRRLPPADALEHAQQFFRARNRSFVLWTREHADADLAAAVSAAGLRQLDDGLSEVFLEHPPAHARPPGGIRLLRAEDERSRQDVLGVVARSHGMGGVSIELASDFFFRPESLAEPHTAAVLAHEDDEPVAAAVCFVAYGIARTRAAAAARPRPSGDRDGRPGGGDRKSAAAEACLRAVLAIAFDELGARGALCQAAGTTRTGLRARAPLTTSVRYLGQPAAPAWG